MTNDRLGSTRDALKYLDEVKAHYSDRPWIYKEFLRILSLFRSEQIDAAGVICRVFDLFEGHEQLVLGFQTFLPDGCTIELPNSAVTESDSKPVLRYQAVGCAESIVVEESGESSRVVAKLDSDGTKKVAARDEGVLHPLHDQPSLKRTPAEEQDVDVSPESRPSKNSWRPTSIGITWLPSGLNV